MNGIKYTLYTNNPNGRPDYWLAEAFVCGIGGTKDEAGLRLYENALRMAQGEPPVKYPPLPDVPADIFDLTTRVAALETECAELRRLLSGVVPMAPRRTMPPGAYYDPPVFPATGPGWPVNPSPISPLLPLVLPDAQPLGGYPIVTCGETGAATK